MLAFGKITYKSQVHFNLKKVAILRFSSTGVHAAISYEPFLLLCFENINTFDVAILSLIVLFV